jgi:hypothetical protein
MYGFRNAYGGLINSARVAQHGFSQTLVPAVENSAWQEKHREVAIAAGAAVDAYARYGGTYTLRNAAWITHKVDPVTNWQMSLRDPEQLAPEMVIASVEAAIGRAEQAAADAAQRERGITGLIAAFLRWPSDLREAVGSEPSVQRTAAGVIGIMGQIFVGAIATALATGLVAVVAELWQLVI